MSGIADSCDISEIIYEILLLVWYAILISQLYFIPPLDQDDPEWFHYPWLPRQVDTDYQVGVYDAGGIRRSQPGQGGTTGPCGQLLWKHLLLSLPQIWKEWSQEEGGREPLGCL